MIILRISQLFGSIIGFTYLNYYIYHITLSGLVYLYASLSVIAILGFFWLITIENNPLSESTIDFAFIDLLLFGLFLYTCSILQQSFNIFEVISWVLSLIILFLFVYITISDIKKDFRNKKPTNYQHGYSIYTSGADDDTLIPHNIRNTNTTSHKIDNSTSHCSYSNDCDSNSIDNSYSSDD